MEFTLCDLCGAAMAPHEHYVVRIDVFADPELPGVSAEELAAARDDELKRLLEQMKHMSAEELQDQVHRRVEFKICPACRAPFLANPLGKPRGVRTAAN
jgi:Zn-finger nucleic acid-binding protein